MRIEYLHPLAIHRHLMEEFDLFTSVVSIRLSQLKIDSDNTLFIRLLNASDVSSEIQRESVKCRRKHYERRNGNKWVKDLRSRMCMMRKEAGDFLSILQTWQKVDEV
ncbi:hypothetical protein AVEN_54682-1 [Araneus ventricosus]|uniref:Uncharacterized protein n=1 Tax=Araneus ventricosus TaxID=182803 RepID=A0A4Y2RW23_ARAVE|nr:hypothetical protein AVEN_54682-1 [Araneus ventricosus]